MSILGRVLNGVVVFDGDVSLPEGAVVSVSSVPSSNKGTSPSIRVAKNQKRVEFPLVPSSKPGSVHLTNGMIADLLDE